MAILGFPNTLWPMFAIPFVGFLLLRAIFGVEVMSAEFQKWLIFVVSATAIIFLIILFFNMLCAPYRIEKERRESAESERNQAIGRLDAATASIPPNLRPLDGTLWNDTESVGEVSGYVGKEPDGKNVIFKKLKLQADIVRGDHYFFNELKLKFVGAEAASEINLSGNVTKSLDHASFEIVDIRPVYVDQTTKNDVQTGQSHPPQTTQSGPC